MVKSRSVADDASLLLSLSQLGQPTEATDSHRPKQMRSQ